MKNCLKRLAVFSRASIFAIICIEIAAAEDDLIDVKIAAAEKPLVEFRNSYLGALERHKEKLQKEGMVENIALVERKIREFKDGAWPDGGQAWTGGGIEAKFVVCYWRNVPQVEKALRAVAAESKSPVVNERVKQRLDYWLRKPVGYYNKGTRVMTFVWDVKQNPMMVGAITGANQERLPLRGVLQNVGIQFGSGTSIVYLEGRGKVLGVNVPGELIKIDQIFREAGILK
jgi:hypothetical protein